jgi:poly-gamma-glutamate synthesis protein (capsule biosynthesis protein)
MKRYNFSNYFLSILMASLLGAFFGFLFFKASSFGFGLLQISSEIAVDKPEDKTTIEKLPPLDLSPISYNIFSAPKSGKAIYIDTYKKTVSEYSDGKMVGSFKIVSLNTLTPLAAGEYKVFKKEMSHRSTRTGAILANVVGFAPSYFIYGVSTSTSVQKGKTSILESVGVSLDDSHKIFSFADLNAKVVVAGDIAFKDISREDRDLLGFSKPSLSAVDLKTKLSLQSKAFLIKDLDTGEHLLKFNETSKFPIASVSKLVTAMVALDNLRQDELVTISKKAISTYGTQGDLVAGEKFKVIDLINALLLVSSNDTAEALAEHLGRDRFLMLMNDKVKSLQMLDTSFKDPSGLSKGNISTPEDLSRLIAHIENYRQDILTITKKKSHQVSASPLNRKHNWFNINRLIRDNNSYYLGGKDGFTGDALMTFTGAFSIPFTEFDYKRFSIALLRSSDRNTDIKKIIDKIVASLRYDDGVLFKTLMNKKRGKQIQTEADNNISMMFVGDIMLDRGVRQLIEKRGKGDYLFPFVFVPFLKDPDILFANLEGPVSDLGYDIGNSYSFRMSPLAIPALKETGFDVLSIANNHIGDWGLSALEDTVNRLRSAGILPVGGGLNAADARDVKIIEKNGIKVGFLGFSDVGPAWLTQQENLPTIVLANDPNFEKIINLASKKVDYLVVSFHFGEEYQSTSNERQRLLAHKAVDAGAKIVIGHHPHVAQELEKYNGGVIAYSLGNFIFDQPFSEETMQGAILEVILDKEGILQINQSKVKMNDAFQPSLLEE